MSLILYPVKSQIAFSVFNYPVRFYGIFMTVAILVGVLVANKVIVKKYSTEESEFFIDSLIYVLIASIFGARAFYVLGNLDFYLQNKSEIFMINHGGLSIFGAIFFGILSLIIYSKIRKKEVLKYLDIYALVMPLAQSIGRFGNYFNQEAFGSPIVNNFPIKLFVEENFRPLGFKNFEFFHPTFLYESALDLILFIFLISFFLKKVFKEGKTFKGEIFFLYLIFYSIIRFFIEGIRIDSVLNIFSMPVVQVICVFVFLISLILFFILKKRS